jgi:hypothetical protein
MAYLVKEGNEHFPCQRVPRLLFALLALLVIFRRKQMLEVLQLHLPIFFHSEQCMNKVGLHMAVLGGPDKTFGEMKSEHENKVLN